MMVDVTVESLAVGMVCVLGRCLAVRRAFVLVETWVSQREVVSGLVRAEE